MHFPAFAKIAAACVAMLIVCGCEPGVSAPVTDPPPPHEASPAAPVVTDALHDGVPAFQITDGRTRAIIVPQLGRVMWYGMVGGSNILFNAPPDLIATSTYKNWGGDKTFIGPHTLWSDKIARSWPPDPSWDGQPHNGWMLPDARVRTEGNVWTGFGIRVTREYSFDRNGDLVIEQTLEKVEGEPMRVCAWDITQIQPPAAIYVRTNPASEYPGAFAWLGKPAPAAEIASLSPTLLRIRPHEEAFYKIGIDAQPPTIACVTDGNLFLVRAETSAGAYPDGLADKSGFPIEFYNHADPGAPYKELQLLSPLRTLSAGDKYRTTIRWSLHPAPGDEATIERTLEK